VAIVAAEALGRLGAVAVPALIAALEEGETRRYAASALASLGDERAVVPLLEALQQPSWDDRWEAAEGLGKLKARVALEPLLPLLQDPDASVRAIAAWALGEICRSQAQTPAGRSGSPGDETCQGRVRTALERACQDEDAQVRQAARKALERLAATGGNGP